MQISKKPIIIWLATVCGLIFTMVFVGGMTRLTNSGLSMVEWKPIMGAIPPLNTEEWMIAFEKYKQYPEFKLINNSMTLDDFKSIFYWEYFHRMLGRLIGLVYFIPLLVFQFTGHIGSKKLNVKLFIGLVLGGLQGLMGWYMVMSGLIDKPDVSHFRLAAHLMLAFLIFCYLFWIILDLINPPKKPDSTWFRLSVIAFLLVNLQIIWGAFTAGLKAGYGFNTFPLMGDHFIPNGMNMLDTLYQNIFENTITIQFVHRYIGWTVLLFASALMYRAFRQRTNKRQSYAIYAFGLSTWGQFILGVLTLVNMVPIPLAIMHQMGAFIVLATTVNLIHSFKA